ncbi:fam-d protein [Plasmodium chabaudi chabaudi]|uniref:Fam-d protein n=2 Tax=Plasmodium chabaudi chabaudi TaxID=31271 RepID=A0A077XEU0_PLACU|nr:fam-d protein [Plasmodium chabaudi chabaudi]SCN60515.1 fam-d protein [Plasmodium chabaudi chabaudi]VTZ68860.1 fam-d protein [Plasmodium chabaudi chabaudi]|eukprot:XP_016655410.1 fam-d protein [Plasmodium chabaudi chabaudi]
MKMINIILPFFILVIFSNVKAASFQSASSSSNPKSIGLVSVYPPFAKFSKFNQKYIPCLDEINKFLRDPEITKYRYEGSNYHWIITDYRISIDNASPYLSKSISKNKTEELKIGASYFMTYINANINHLFSKYMHKYDFESSYDDNLNIFAKDLKTLIYDSFEKNFKEDLIRYENEPKKKKLRDSAKQTFYELMHNSEIEIQGYFIKISKDGNYEHLSQNKSLYFDISINKNGTDAKYELKIPIRYAVDLVSKH